jgi:NAD-dependent dihydropyrimidine dehydrogenase PreA subunit
LNAENLANPDEIIRICPTDVYVRDPENKIAVRDELACTLCMDCVEKAEAVDAKKSPPIKVDGDETSFVFYVESTKAVPTKRIVKEAAKILDRKATALEDLLRKGLE